MLDLIPHCSFQHWRCCFGLLCLVPLGSLWLDSFQLSSAPPQGQPQVTLGCTRVPFCCLSHWCCFHLSHSVPQPGHRGRRWPSAPEEEVCRADPCNLPDGQSNAVPGALPFFLSLEPRPPAKMSVV